MPEYLTFLMQAFVFIFFCIIVIKFVGALFGRKIKIIEFDRTDSNIDRQTCLKILLLVLAAFALCFLFAMLFAHTPGSTVLETLKRAFVKGDAHHYLVIAKNGYTNVGPNRVYIAFFPLFPYAVRALYNIIPEYYISSVVINFIFTYGSCIYLYKLTASIYSKKIALRPVALLLVQPVFFFMTAPYTEPFFLFFSITCIYYLKKRNYLLSAFLGFFAALSRNVGIFLIIPFAIEFLFADKERITKRILKLLPYAALILSGLLIYLLINYSVTGDPLRFMYHLKAFWHQGFGNFVNTMGYSFKGILPFVMEYAIFYIPTVVTMILFLIVLYYKMYENDLGLYVFTLIYFLFIYSPEWLLSSMRYCLAFFPLYLMMGKYKNGVFHAVFTVSLIAMLFLLYIYVNRYPIF